MNREIILNFQRKINLSSEFCGKKCTKKGQREINEDCLDKCNRVYCEIINGVYEQLQRVKKK